MGVHAFLGNTVDSRDSKDLVQLFIYYYYYYSYYFWVALACMLSCC